MDYELLSIEYGPWTKDCELWTLDFGQRTMDCEPWPLGRVIFDYLCPHQMETFNRENHGLLILDFKLWTVDLAL